ncbi:MAG: 3-deoxy-7-phosphoheptulonate synthase [Acidimicrobiia bacterium]|nr:3-deoxy-7-phosphoheptulonate synthase [Acidimicrobiia bacterium]
MIIVMSPDSGMAEIEAVVQRLHEAGCEAHVSTGERRTVIGAIGDRGAITSIPWEAISGVEKAVPVLSEFRFVSREFQHEDSIVDVGGVPVGGNTVTLMAGPCAVESRDQLFRAAEAVLKGGATVLRGDAFKPRTSPYSFQGLGEEGLELLAEAREQFGLPFVAEALDPRDVELISGYADLIRVGTRNMANFTLLTELGRQPKPVMLKRGFTATIEEWLNAAEYIYKEGNHNIIMAERGIRTFETASRNTLDVTAVPTLQRLSHLPVLIDPSHSGGRRDLVLPLSLAGVAAGAQALLVDVHPAPDEAKVDGAQAIVPAEFEVLADKVRAVASALGRE